MLDQAVASDASVTADIDIMSMNEHLTTKLEPIEFINHTYAIITFPFERSNSGFYTCTAKLLSLSLHLKPSTIVMSDELKLTTGMCSSCT